MRFSDKNNEDFLRILIVRGLTIPKWINSVARRLPGPLRRSSGLFRLVLMHAIQMVDDADFNAIPYLALSKRSRPHAVVCDIGANAGQSAIALGHLIPESAIVSFEPQKAFRPELRLTQLLLGRRHSVRFVALGAESHENQLLYIPRKGGIKRSARASLFQGSESRKINECSISVPLQTLDEQGLAPTLLKIDVEGAEADVIRGGEQTIKTYRPFVMAEINSSFDACSVLLSSWNYKLFTWNLRTKQFETVGKSVNFFAIPIEFLEDIPCS